MTKNYWTYYIDRCSDTKLLNVYINPIQYWKDEECLADQYSDEEWNDLEPILDILGLYEVVESTFETEEFLHEEDLEQALLNEGFVKQPDFEMWLAEY